MDCQVPHQPWLPPLSQRDIHLNRRKVNEDLFAPDSRLVCPNIGFRSNGSFEVIKPNGSANQPLLMNLAEHHTLPLPIFPPSSIKCGRDPLSFGAKPQQVNQMLCEGNLALECRLQMGNNKDLSLQEIKLAWKNFMDGQELPSHLRCLETIMNRYGYDKVPIASFAGGSLASIRLNDDRYLIHSVMEWDCALCLTRVSANDMKNTPLEIGMKIPLDDGMLYQIATPCKSLQNFYTNDAKDPIFATRQLHTTRVWKVEDNEADSHQPVVTNVQEYCDPTSTVQCIDLNHYILGELGELRSKKLLISHVGRLVYTKKLEKEYSSCMYLNHPKTLILSSAQNIDLVDSRCSQSDNLRSVFSIDNQELRTYYNFSPSETIVCVCPSSRDHICFIGTESSLLVWDIRNGNRPLSKTHHLMDNPPCWITSVPVGSDTEWLFLDSQMPGSSCMLGLTWGSQRLCLDGSTDSFTTSTIEIEPRDRWTILNTLEMAQRKGLGLDWSVQNRFHQNRCGITCDKDSDGNVHIWQSTVAGDVFVQQFNVNERIGSSQQKSFEAASAWLSEWIQSVEENEEWPSSTPRVDQTERFIADVLLEEIEPGNREESKNNATHRYHQAFSVQEFGLPDSFEQHCPVDYTRKAEGRGLNYNNEWSTKNVVHQGFLESEDTFACDFDDELISSTPLEAAAGKSRAFSSPGFLLPPVTPAMRRVKPNPFSTPKPVITSTPLNRNSAAFNASGSSFQTPKSNVRSRAWDDF